MSAVDREADRKATDLRRVRIDGGAEHGEHEEEGGDRLEEDALREDTSSASACPPSRVAVATSLGKSALSAYAASSAPSSCATMYSIAINGSMRRVTRKPIVTAGFRCPEMRIVAVTMIARINPCAAATARRGYRHA